MTLKLQLSPNLERRLEAQASKLGLLLDVYVLSLIEKQLSSDAQAKQAAPAQPRPRRQPGSAKGLIQMAADFDEPLEDFEAYR